MKKCVFFDRDGIVNESPGAGYVQRWEDFHLLPDFVEVLRKVRSKGYEAVIVTNQRGVARGIVKKETVEEIHKNLRVELKEKHNLELLDVLFCPHNIGECECRKPKPGMLLEAAKRHGIDLRASWMIGDGQGDVDAGKRASCRTIMVGGVATAAQPDFKVKDMAELNEKIEKML